MNYVMNTSSNHFCCQLVKSHVGTKARVVRAHTPHGEFLTPMFMPVGTRAGVNNLTPQELLNTGSQMILGGNTYHMLCAPGMETIKKAGGMHPFMGWKGPMLTDSGGFQIFSLSKNSEICRIEEDGAYFTLPGTKQVIRMTPEKSIETQKIIGADIIMAFDQCTPDNCTHEEVQGIMNRTHRWLKQSIDYHEKRPLSHHGFAQALFGIVQGGTYPDLRRESAQFVSGLNLDGIAIGGETVGFDMDATVEVIQWIEPLLPSNKLRYAMGVGMSPQDLIRVVREGVDMFDCVAPTRNARHGSLYCGTIKPDGNWLKFESPFENERIQIKKASYANDLSPVMEDCHCYTCQNFSRAYLHHLFKQKMNSFTALASIHNIHVMQEVCNQMRTLILDSH